MRSLRAGSPARRVGVHWKNMYQLRLSCSTFANAAAITGVGGNPEGDEPSASARADDWQLHMPRPRPSRARSGPTPPVAPRASCKQFRVGDQRPRLVAAIGWDRRRRVAAHEGRDRSPSGVCKLPHQVSPRPRRVRVPVKAEGERPIRWARFKDRERDAVRRDRLFSSCHGGRLRAGDSCAPVPGGSLGMPSG